MSESLIAEIRAGRLRVGDLLPSEPQLSLRYGVSRQTVRAALRTLQQRGLIGSRHGVGSTVLDKRAEQTSYSLALNSIEDLLQYATTTAVKVIEKEQFVVDGACATRFGCRPGEHWWRIRTVRTEPRSRVPIAVSDIHVPLAFAGVLDELSKGSQPVFRMIEKRFRQPAVEIQQELRCVGRLTRSECELLCLPLRSPGLEVTRRYIGRDGRVLEVARSVHPPETFRYPMRLLLRHGGAA